ncbi:amidohydrolase family protein [Cyanothece sp. BG0011]|uniref:amidohydrolase family protein n=1 Tax=Cyanothece sp. BG0011 TaxID=2082950 RepID=UPI0018E4EB10|nr:amidohydrolase family protein [Cyanothece sp. BG0011]
MKQIIWGGITLINDQFLTHWGVYIEGQVIIDVDRFENLKKRYPDTDIIGGENLLLIPGLVNSHDHGRVISPVGFNIDDSWLELWLLQLEKLPNIDPYLAASIEGITLLKSGVTTVSHSHNPRNWDNLYQEASDTIKGYQNAGIRVAFHPPIVDQNLLDYTNKDQVLSCLSPSLLQHFEKYQNTPPISNQDYFDICSQLFNNYHDTINHQVKIQVSPAGGQWCSDQLMIEAVEWAKKHNTKVQMHLLETQYQRQYAYECWGKSFVKHLEKLGVLGHWLTCAHMVWIDESDLSILANKNVKIVHNPSSNLRLRSGIAPIAKMLTNNISVGIGLDGLGLDDDQDFLREMRLAWTLINQPGMNSTTIKPEEIWAMATQKGVEITLGNNVNIGQLKKGNLADLVLIDYQQIPLRQRGFCHNSKLLRWLSKQQVKSVMVAGKWVIIDGQCQTLNEADLNQALADIIMSIKD